MINLGLGRISACLKSLNNPHLAYQTVHIAGTNGKGSVSAIIANTCRLAGIKTGLYTSPHLVNEWDCITIDGKTIDKHKFHKTRLNIRDDNLSSFEELTATAFKVFKDEAVELAVIETGLGGRLDATNVVKPLLTVITKIGIDHTAFLGDTLAAIAKEKAGIIKANTQVIINGSQDSQEIFDVVEEANESMHNPPVLRSSVENDFRRSNEELARLALVMLSEKYPSITNVIEEGLRTKMKGRFETVDLAKLGGSSNALLDGAHNEQSIAALASILHGQHTFIFALSTGKDPAILANLLRPVDTFFAVEFESVDGMPWVKPVPAAEIYSKLTALGHHGHQSTVLEAIRTAKSNVVICGSLYLVGQVHRLLEQAIPSNSVYNPIEIESKIQAYWPRKRSSKPTKTFLLPPPNVTGSLHIGHALTVAIQDAYVRYYNPNFNVRWIPGSDHAGIATQTVVSKALAKRGIDAKALSRNEFISEIWKWKEEYGDKISHQIRRLGADLEWESEYFTLDKRRCDAVNEAFRRLWDAGLVYREKKMINWSIQLGSVISDIEVDSRQIDGPEMLDGVPFGTIWTVNFDLVNGPGYVSVQTTRPETLYADRTLAVHPDDTRYQHLVGQQVRHPLLNLNLNIIADSFVDPAFGTGVVKITPAHDTDDYAVSLRHSLPLISAFGLDGKLIDADEFTGLDRLQARQQIVDKLESLGAVSSQAHSMRINLCSRTGSVIEPLLMPQWFIRMKTLADAVLKQDIAMEPRVRTEWLRWLNNIQDWCVSRQLVWGHQIPLWRDEATGKYYPTAAEGRVQDDDVLDTWFSSALLPLSAFGWPKAEVAPLEFIESGPDILFFWLARMAMLCTFLSKDKVAPFREIILHPIIRDTQGRKMSKSLGNVIDPLDIIDDKSHAAGADALRFALIDSTVQEQTLNLDMRNVQQGHYLCTKLWNAVKFLQHHASEVTEGPMQAVDLWIIGEFNKYIQAHHQAFTERSLFVSTTNFRQFFANFCDFYLEFVKIDIQRGADARTRLFTYRTILQDCLILVHPIMPHITEELWHQLCNITTISTAQHPEIRQVEETPFLSVLTILKSLRSEKAESAKLHILDHSTEALCRQYQPHLERLSTTKLEFSETYSAMLEPGIYIERKAKPKRVNLDKLAKIRVRMASADYHRVPQHVREKDELMLKVLS